MFATAFVWLKRICVDVVCLVAIEAPLDMRGTAAPAIARSCMAWIKCDPAIVVTVISAISMAVTIVPAVAV